MTTLLIDDLLYPQQPQAAGTRCSHCWQPSPLIAWTPHPLHGEMRRLCPGCRVALRYGRPVELTDTQLVETWLWLARQYQNQRWAEHNDLRWEETGITEAVIDEALANHTPVWLPPQARWERFEGLIEDMFRIQDAEGPCAVLDVAATGPDHDGETFVSDLHGFVDDAVHKLIGRTR